MSPALLLGLALSAPPAEAEARLLQIAAGAKKAGDAVRLKRALRGWASLRRHPQLPSGLEGEAADATAWASEAGQLRIYGSRLPDRVRVGIDDPAELVGRLDVYLETASGERARLTRAEVEAAGRNEYLIPESARDREIVVEAVMTDAGGGAEVILRRSILAPSGSASIPEKPDPKRAAERAGFVEEKAVAARIDEPAFAWWWIAIGVAAAGLAGVAIYQEAKD